MGASLIPTKRRVRRGAALLEVVVSLSILLICMAVVGAVFSNGQYYVERAEQLARADIMTQRLIEEVETGIIAIGGGETFGNFGDEGAPNMYFRVAVSPDQNVPDLLRVDIDVYDGDPENDEENASLITTTHLLRAMPKGIDFARDFGFDEEQLAQITDAIPGGEAIFDPKNFDPRSLASLDLDTLVQMLPMLMQAFGGNLGAGDLSALMQAAANGDTAMLRQLTQGLQQAQQGGEAGQGPREFKPGDGPDEGGGPPPGGPPPGGRGPGRGPGRGGPDGANPDGRGGGRRGGLDGGGGPDGEGPRGDRRNGDNDLEGRRGGRGER